LEFFPYLYISVVISLFLMQIVIIKVPNPQTMKLIRDLHDLELIEIMSNKIESSLVVSDSKPETWSKLSEQSFFKGWLSEEDSRWDNLL
jgi:hypothetical protein